MSVTVPDDRPPQQNDPVSAAEKINPGQVDWESDEYEALLRHKASREPHPAAFNTFPMVKLKKSRNSQKVGLLSREAMKSSECWELWWLVAITFVHKKLCSLPRLFFLQLICFENRASGCTGEILPLSETQNGAAYPLSYDNNITAFLLSKQIFSGVLMSAFW